MKKVVVNIENIKWENQNQHYLPTAINRHEFTMEDDQNVEGLIGHWLADNYDKHNGFDFTVVSEKHGPFLENVMDGISFDNSDQFNEGQLQELIKKEMPGYEIQTWDLDQYGNASEIFGSAMAEVEWYVSRGIKIEDIQYVEEWCTDSCDAYFCILAIKPENKGA